MPSNSSNKLKTMLGFHSVIARRSSDRLSLNPKGMTSWPAFFKCEITSYSVRHSSISFSVDPLSESGGTSVEWTNTRARTFFTALPSQRHPRQFALFVRLRESRHQPLELSLELAPRTADVEVQRLRPCDQQPQHLMHEILAECARTLNLLTQRCAHFAEHGRRLRRCIRARRACKYLEQQFVGARAARQAVARKLLLIMFTQRAGLVRHVLDGAAVGDQRFLSADLLCELIDVLKLRIGRPAHILAPPGGMRLWPDPDGSRKIFLRIGLGVPRAQMLHEAAAAGPRPIRVGIGKRGRSECRAPGFQAAQPISRIQSVSGLVAQNAHQPIAIAALHFAHQSALEADQPLVREVERDRDARDTIGRQPFLRHPAMRSKTYPSPRQLAIQTLDGLLHFTPPYPPLPVPP